MSARAASLAAVAAAAVAVAALVGVRNFIVDGPLERLSQRETSTGVVYEGSWLLPRGGPYVFGFESPNGPASLSIDGRVVARGQGKKSARVVFPAQVASVRFEAADGARLLWHPPGRRGPLEYVPASSLSPEPPERAEFLGWAGASPVDGFIAGMMVLILVALVIYLSRAHWRRLDRQTAAWMGAVFAIALALRLFDLGGAGQTWDEDVNWSAGRNYITNILSLDFEQASWVWNLEHPPVTKYVAGLGAQLADGYGPARALSALMVALACALMVVVGARLFSRRVGALGGLIAAFSPHLIAHGKIVGHEAPTALLWTVAIALCLRAHDAARSGTEDDPLRLHKRFAVIGVVFGLAVFSRFVNVLMAPLIGAILLMEAPAGQRKRTVAVGLGFIPVVAILTGFVLWPRLWSSPIAHMQEAWAVLKKPHSPEPFLGTITNVPPRTYFAIYLGATAPMGVVLGALAWLWRALARRERASAVLLLWLLAPMVVILSPVRQDGVRYIMPSLMALSLMSAAGFDYLAGALGRVVVPRVERTVFSVLAAGLTIYLGAIDARIHPYYLDYYGEHVGGPRTVAERKSFEIAWWGEGIADAIDYINRHAGPSARVFKRCVEPSHLTWLRGDLWAREAHQADRADWILVYQPSWKACPIPDDAELVHEVTAQGAPLARVYRRKR